MPLEIIFLYSHPNKIMALWSLYDSSHRAVFPGYCHTSLALEISSSFFLYFLYQFVSIYVLFDKKLNKEFSEKSNFW